MITDAGMIRQKRSAICNIDGFSHLLQTLFELMHQPDFEGIADLEAGILVRGIDRFAYE